MQRGAKLSFCWAVVFMLGLPLTAQGQVERTAIPEAAISTYLSARAQAKQIPILERSIAVDLQGTSFEQALAQIASRVGLQLTYSTDLLPNDNRIFLHAPHIMAAEAVLRVLQGTSLDLLVSPTGHAVLVRCSPETCEPRIERSGAQIGRGSGTSYVRLGEAWTDSPPPVGDEPALVNSQEKRCNASRPTWWRAYALCGISPSTVWRRIPREFS